MFSCVRAVVWLVTLAVSDVSSFATASLAGVVLGGGLVFFEQERETCPCAPQKKHLPSFLYRSLLASVTAFDRLALVSIAFDGPPRRGLNSPLLFRAKNGFFFFSAKNACRWGSMLVRIACRLRVESFH